MKAIKLIGTALLCFACVFLLGAFIKWEINAAKWDWSNRSLAVFASIVLTGFTISLFFDKNKNQGGEK